VTTNPEDPDAPPVWACNDWGDPGHDWIECHECNYGYEAWRDDADDIYPMPRGTDFHDED
jgi:hypothetical protein